MQESRRYEINCGVGFFFLPRTFDMGQFEEGLGVQSSVVGPQLNRRSCGCVWSGVRAAVLAAGFGYDTNPTKKTIDTEHTNSNMI